VSRMGTPAPCGFPETAVVLPTAVCLSLGVGFESRDQEADNGEHNHEHFIACHVLTPRSLVITGGSIPIRRFPLLNGSIPQRTGLHKKVITRPGRFVRFVRLGRIRRLFWSRATVQPTVQDARGGPWPSARDDPDGQRPPLQYLHRIDPSLNSTKKSLLA